MAEIPLAPRLAAVGAARIRKTVYLDSAEPLASLNAWQLTTRSMGLPVWATRDDGRGCLGPIGFFP